MISSNHPLSSLNLETPFFDLGEGFYDVVQPGAFKGIRLRWRSDEVLAGLGVDPARASDDDLARAFGAFEPLPQRKHPPLAQRYIGYQFRNFNPYLGDGRGFTLAQVRAPDGRLLDLGTKGSGPTPWSRGGDGMLTLKGGVREVIAAEFLHAMGIKTSRALTLVEHDAKLWRNDEDSPTRASILVRAGEGHIRFGTFERIYYLERDSERQRAMMTALADHVVALYYPALLELPAGPERYVALYRAVLERTSRLVAGWTAAGFCHGVLNTDNMNIAGDSFDYGPYRFMEDYDPEFTAAYFDEGGLYAFEAQPDAVYWNLSMLIRPFSLLAPKAELETVLEAFPERYRTDLRGLLLPRLGFEDRGSPEDRALLSATLGVLRTSGCNYHGLFWALTDRVGAVGLEPGGPRLPASVWRSEGAAVQEAVETWRRAWWARLEGERGGSDGAGRGEAGSGSVEAGSGRAEAAGGRAEAGSGRAEAGSGRAEAGSGRAEAGSGRAEAGSGTDAEGGVRAVVAARLRRYNPFVVPYRPEIEHVWEAIARFDDWGPLYAWLEQLRRPFSG